MRRSVSSSITGSAASSTNPIAAMRTKSAATTRWSTASATQHPTTHTTRRRQIPALSPGTRDGGRNHGTADCPGDEHPGEHRAGRGRGYVVVVEDRLQPGAERDEHADADERQPRKRADEIDRPHRAHLGNADRRRRSLAARRSAQAPRRGPRLRAHAIAAWMGRSGPEVVALPPAAAPSPALATAPRNWPPEPTAIPAGRSRRGR